jgi:glycerol uptake facilitator-like aquaporin
MKQRHIVGLLAEAIGTFVLVMVVLNVSRYGLPFFTALAAGIAIAVFYGAMAKFSGGHFNPAITLGLFSVRQISFVKTVGVIIAQAIGALAGWQLYEYFTERSLKNATTAFNWRIMIAELVGMIVFTLIFAAVLVKQKYEAWQTAAIIGLAYFLGLTVAGLASNGILNPALALGVRSFDLNYLIGPVVGALIGFNLYQYVFVPVINKSAEAKIVTSTPVSPAKRSATAKKAKKAKK